VSRLALFPDEAPPLAKAPPFALKSRRRRPLHPEQIDARLAARSAGTGSLPFAPFGWLLRLYRFDGSREYRNIPPGASYEAACAIRTTELRTGRYEKIWLEQKREP
jgi:hypothetical protein